jgi:O-antigen/teichoic acid export membrane protein
MSFFPLRRSFSSFKASTNTRGILHLVSGTSLAQLIAVAVTPLITRLYSPTDYASVALFSSIALVAASVASGRFEAAVPLPPESPDGERKSLQLVAISVLVATATSLAGLALIVATQALGVGVWEQELGVWVYWLPIAVWLMVTSQVLFQYASRRRAYPSIAKIAPTSKAIIATLQIGLGYAGAGRLGLMLPTVASPLVGSLILARILRSGITSTPVTRSEFGLRQLWRVAVRYREFPIVVSWISLVNALNFNIQIMVMAAAFTSTYVGQYALAMGIVALPVSLIAASVNTVYYREMAARVGDIPGSLSLTKKTILALASIATPLVVVLALTAIPLFPLIFGNQWSEAGRFAVALLPWVWVRFIGIPLSAALAVFRRQTWQLIWQLTTLAVFAMVFLGGASLGWTPLTCTWVSSALAVPVYLALIPLVILAIRRQPVGN